MLTDPSKSRAASVVAVRRHRFGAPLKLVALAVIGALTVAGCSTPDSADGAANGAASESPVPTQSSPPPDGSSGAPSSQPSDAPSDGSQRVRPSLAEYFDKVPEASDVQLGRVRERTAGFTSYDVSYRSDGLRITGVLNVPTGRGPFPAVVLAHGWIDRDIYVSGQGMTRERGFLAERGYVTLHVDYRGHAGSDDDPSLVRQLYLGYAEDVLGAVSALRQSDLPVQDDAVALMGRSMGGSVVLQALEMAPGHANAGIVYSGQSSLESENYERWGGDGSGFGDEFAARHGVPTENPTAWRAMSTRPYFDRITEPVLLIHGTRDEQCPPQWAQATYRALDRAGVDARLNWYQDEYHAFGPRFEQSMQDADAFFDMARQR